MTSDKSLSKIRIILVGGRDVFGREASGKSTTGNIILGRNAFEVGRRTTRSVKAEGEVHGRHVTVVDTPGWVWCCSVENTPNFDRLEIMRSTTLCQPGPHAFLLVIPVNSNFPHICRAPLESQLELLSDKIWKHIIVLFSCVAPLKKKIKESQDMMWLVGKCQNRYHFLNIKSCADCSQVVTLLEKMEEMVAQNNGHYLQIDKGISVGDKQDTGSAKANRRKRVLQACIRDVKQHKTDIRIVLIGAVQGAKSSAGNLILGKKVFAVNRPKTLRTTVCCAINQAKVHNRRLTVVDTPGWYYNYPVEKTPEMDKLEIRRSVHLCAPGPHVILLIIPILTCLEMTVHTAVEKHMGLLGEKVWNHTIVLFTMGDWLGDTTIEERIEKEDKHLELLIEKCGNRYHVFNCKNHTDHTQVTELLEKIEEMMMENNNSHYVPEMESNPCLEIDLMLKTTKTNMTKMNRQTQIIQELLREIKLAELRIVLLGVEDTWKFMAGNIILRGESLFPPKEAFEIPTMPRSSKCVMKQSKVGGCQVCG
ncbi:GTPase IMAP family member 8-like isoform X1 [Sinocyclocheilus rhinocerous]|uniref:GTPase IMAP family member 8-like isoform X1 n=1 Tax=Sinocyclocheilus rhinocerous TaxID=307959 RepID=UPI0007B80D1A|nr:PREDICTED: GTPase IMAP family member 8-like isoform X1 [Sinocyclocheilus rhinocerous]XP_016403746.1 PREDICTED: GTPase IMAP family member 8-like isoform X1 [Sinocyclocheilus rhinocerous]